MLSLIAKRAARRHTELVRPTVVATRGMCDIKSKHPVVSPHVTIYAFPVAAITSVTNRITGGALWVGLSGVGVYSIMGGDVASTVACIKASSLAAPAKFSVAFPVLYHYCYSIRHLVSFFFFCGLEEKKLRLNYSDSNATDMHCDHFKRVRRKFPLAMHDETA